MAGAVDAVARNAVLAWQSSINQAHNAQATGLGVSPGQLDAARAAFFGPAGPGAQRQIIKTGAIVPGGKDGIILSRFYIPSQGAAFGALFGDNRGPSTDPNASARFLVAWDTRTGEVSITVSPSTVDPVGPLAHPDGLAPYPVDPGPPEVVPARPITTTPGGDPNNFVITNQGPGGLSLDYNLLNSAIPIGQANGHLDINLDPNNVSVHQSGDNYPAGEFVQYRDGDTRVLGDKPMSPIQEGAAAGLDTNDQTWNTPR